MGNRSDIEKEIKEAMESGKYKIAGLDMFDMVDKIKLNDKLKSHMIDAENYFYEYLNDITMLKDSKPGLNEYLNAIKAGDIIDNQTNSVN